MMAFECKPVRPHYGHSQRPNTVYHYDLYPSLEDARSVKKSSAEKSIGNPLVSPVEIIDPGNTKRAAVKLYYLLDKEDIENEITNPNRTSFSPEEVKYIVSKYSEVREYLTKEQTEEFLYEFRRLMDNTIIQVDYYKKGIDPDSIISLCRIVFDKLGERPNLNGLRDLPAKTIKGKILKENEEIYHIEDIKKAEDDGYEKGYKKALEDIKNNAKKSTKRAVSLITED